MFVSWDWGGGRGVGLWGLGSVRRRCFSKGGGGDGEVRYEVLK